MLKDIFSRLSKYLVFCDNDGERETDYFSWFENDIINNNGCDVIETVDTLINNNEILAFPHLDDLTGIKRDINRYLVLQGA